MSDTNISKPKVQTSWTDKERLTYLFALIDNSNVKFDYASTPRPQNRSIIACQRMMERLRGTLKTELEALQCGSKVAKQKSVGGKRKVGSEEEGEGGGGAQKKRKRGRKGKKGGMMDVDADVDVDGDESEEMWGGVEVKVKVKKEGSDEEMETEV